MIYLVVVSGLAEHSVGDNIIYLSIDIQSSQMNLLKIRIHLCHISITINTTAVSMV